MRANARLVMIVMLAVLACVVLPSGIARADAGPARQQYEAGTRAFAEKRYVEAALDFEAAATLAPNGVPYFMAAQSWELADRPERAADAYRQAIDTPGTGNTELANARARVAVLERSLGTAHITSRRREAHAQIDDLGEARLPAYIHARPGVHTLTLRTGDDVRTRRITLEAGATLAVDADAGPPAQEEPLVPKPMPAPEPTRGAPHPTWWTTTHALGMVLGAVGVVGGGVAVGLGARAASVHDDYQRSPTKDGYDEGVTLVTATNATLVAALVFAAAGAIMLVWPTAPSPSRAGRAFTPTF